MAQRKEFGWRKLLQLGSSKKKEMHSSTIQATQLSAGQSSVPTNSTFSGAFFSGAHHVPVSGGEFYNAYGNITINHNSDFQNIGGTGTERASKVLICPSPSQNFVGRDDTLSSLSKIFSPPVIGLYSAGKKDLKNFIKNHMKWCTVINLDTSSVEALHKAVDKKIKGPLPVSGNAVLVLENMDQPLALEEHLPKWLCGPTIITASNGDIARKVSEETFEFPNSAKWDEIQELGKAVKSCLQLKQCIVTIVAAGGAGKTQLVLRFVADNFARRFQKAWKGSRSGGRSRKC
ncbi:hypothetical protein GYMLUDRAFT_696592 [Collybiopsis luxurians FD-317 M1]|uniref:Uncharacterized protein n=1 Tax=Collybiopsis luxurians FD-317 M1 TaxID=944289 RepID=A0A0D0C7M3_9AGAR|nr:hypothetical protein GYMLUDRAFT_696592 [Collybiopsis luxurians FD-317 M1]